MTDDARILFDRDAFFQMRLDAVRMRLRELGARKVRRDAHNALHERNFNMVVRRAQEGVGLTLKGALKLLGVDYPKAHDVAPVFSEQVRRKRGGVDVDVLERIEEVSLWLSQARVDDKRV